MEFRFGGAIIKACFTSLMKLYKFTIYIIMHVVKRKEASKKKYFTCSFPHSVHQILSTITMKDTLEVCLENRLKDKSIFEFLTSIQVFFTAFHLGKCNMQIAQLAD